MRTSRRFNVTTSGINGFGRIKRQVRDHRPLPRQAGSRYINDLVATTNANLLKYDSNYGRWNKTSAESDAIVVDGRAIGVLRRRPGAIPWAALVDIVIESTGLFTDATKAVAHKRDSVKKVVISAPAKNEDFTIVLGVNPEKYDPSRHHVISNASCTTNGLAPVVKVLVDNLGLVKGQMTTIHSYTNSQQILDKAAGTDLREMRAGAMNIVPTSTGAAKALRLVIPEVDGILDGLSYRVPTPTVSIVEVVALTEKETTKDELNALLRDTSLEKMKGILGFTMDPVVSMDMKGDERSSIVDGQSTNVVGGNLVKVAAWYNEWGYACRISDLCAFLVDRGCNHRPPRPGSTPTGIERRPTPTVRAAFGLPEESAPMARLSGSTGPMIGEWGLVRSINKPSEGCPVPAPVLNLPIIDNPSSRALKSRSTANSRSWSTPGTRSGRSPHDARPEGARRPRNRRPAGEARA
jgi:glyceraldehyde 3-phosphate dehydrogenase